MPYKYIDTIKSDVKFQAEGASLKELFESSALALMGVVCETSQVNPDKKIELEVKGKSIEDLLYNFLSEIIAQVDIEQMFFSRFDIVSISKSSLKAYCYGEDMTPEKGLTVVKAVSYHDFSVEKTDKGYKAVVVMDI